MFNGWRERSINTALSNSAINTASRSSTGSSSSSVAGSNITIMSTVVLNSGRY